MTSELDTTSVASVAIAPMPDPSDEALQRIVRQAQAMDAAHKLGSALAGTDMVPAEYKGKPDNATAAILYGAELGLSAIQSLQNVFLVKGRPAVYARTMAAQVIAAGHQLGEVEATPDQVTWAGRRGDTGQEFTSTWTMARAEQAGYTSNAKYKSNPVEMLRAKAITEVCRIMAPEVLLGMAHSIEDLTLEGEIVTRPERTPIAGPRGGTAALREKLGVASDASAKPEPAQVEAPAKATAAEVKSLRAALDTAGITTEERPAFLASRVGHAVKALSELTSAEVAAVLDFLANGERVEEAGA